MFVYINTLPVKVGCYKRQQVQQLFSTVVVERWLYFSMAFEIGHPLATCSILMYQVP